MAGVRATKYMTSEFPASSILDCNHCGNRTPHTLRYEHAKTMLYDDLDDGSKLHNTYTWLCYECGTCEALNLYGSFFNVDLYPHDLKKAKLHPRESDMIPPPDRKSVV